MDLTGDPNETTFNYDLRLTFDTSFTGKDLLRTRLRAGNFESLPFGSSSQIFKLDKAEGTDNSVEVDRLFYRFPVGDSFRFTVGALVRNTEMLSFTPQAYNSSILDFFRLAGASGTYNKATGAGVGVSWKQQVEKGNPAITFDTNYVANNGFADSSVGAFTEESGINWLSQLGVKGRNWGAAVAYRYGSENSRLRVPTSAPPCPAGGSASSLGFAAYWAPIDAGWIPSISAGYGYNWQDEGISDSQSWMVGLQWDDAFLNGSDAGFALGQPPFTGSRNDSMLYELWYQLPGHRQHQHHPGAVLRRPSGLQQRQRCLGRRDPDHVQILIAGRGPAAVHPQTCPHTPILLIPAGISRPPHGGLFYAGSTAWVIREDGQHMVNTQGSHPGEMELPLASIASIHEHLTSP